jgi:hypothetical protein
VFFLAAHGTFSKIDHILGHKASLSKSKKIEVTPCILSDHNTLKLEFNNKNNCRKYTNELLKHQWFIEEIREEIKSFLKDNENEKTTYQNLWGMAKAVLRENYMNAYIKRTERSQISNLMLLLEPAWPFFWDLLYVWNLPWFPHSESESSFLLALQYCMPPACPARFPITVPTFYKGLAVATSVTNLFSCN